MLASRTFTVVRSELARAVRDGKPSEVIDQLRAELDTLRPEHAVARVIAKFPPLTDEQISRVAAILRGAGRPQC